MGERPLWHIQVQVSDYNEIRAADELFFSVVPQIQYYFALSMDGVFANSDNVLRMLLFLPVKLLKCLAGQHIQLRSGVADNTYLFAISILDSEHRGGDDGACEVYYVAQRLEDYLHIPQLL